MDWVKNIDQLVAELDKRPQFNFEAFHLEPVEKVLSDLIDKELHLVVTPKGWKKKEETFGAHLFLFSIFSATLQASVFFTVEKKSIRLLLEDPLLSASNSEILQEITEGYLHYLLLEALAELRKQQELSSISLVVQREKIDSADEALFCFEIDCKTQDASIVCNLYVPPSFRTALENHFSTLPFLQLSEASKESIFLDLSIEVGSSLVKKQDLHNLHQGDFLLLDRCLYDPVSKKGSFLLVLKDTPIFRGKVTKEGCKLAEIPVYQEVGKMDENDKEDAFYQEDSLFDETEQLEPSVETLDELDQQNTTYSPRQSIQLDDLELTVKIELCRIQMNLKSLSELSIGNLLPLDASIDQGVNLVINGRHFARGELLRLGEQLGVRILELTGH